MGYYDAKNLTARSYSDKAVYTIVKKLGCKLVRFYGLLDHYIELSQLNADLLSAIVICYKKDSYLSCTVIIKDSGFIKV